MNDDVGAVFDWTHEVRRRERVVDDQRKPVFVRDARHGLDVQHVDLRVADRFGEDRLGVRPDRAPNALDVADIDERDVYAEPRKRMRKGVVGAAVQRVRGDDGVAGLRDVEQRVDVRGLSARNAERRDAAFELRDALFEHVRRRIVDARVDIAELFEREKACGVIDVIEFVRRRLIDWNRTRFGRGIARVAAVDGDRVKPRRAFGGCNRHEYLLA